jgi:hypothetical protein
VLGRNKCAPSHIYLKAIRHVGNYSPLSRDHVGTTGDIHPFMRIASVLQALGRKVTFIINSYHANLVQAAWLPFVGLGTDEDYLRVIANPDLWDPKKGFSALMANYRDQIEQIPARAGQSLERRRATCNYSTGLTPNGQRSEHDIAGCGRH